MNEFAFPDSPSQRRVVMLLKRHDIDKCKLEGRSADFLRDDEVHVLKLPFDLKNAMPLALKNIVAFGLDSPGKVLVQSPYDVNRYVEASEAAKYFALEKHMRFSELCRLLGAREVKVLQIDLHTKEGRTSVDVKAGKAALSGQVTASADKINSFCSEMSLCDTFQGCDPDIEAAENLLYDAGLIRDQNMIALVNLRRGSTNRIQRREISLNLSTEARNNLSVVGRLRVPKFVTLAANYDAYVKEQSEYKLTLEVQF